MKNLKTPITYYGGKQQLVSKLLPMIPAHKIYCEPFFGGGALFFAKPPSKVEFINDLNEMVINFYRVAKSNFEALNFEIDLTLYSEAQFNQARTLYKNATGEMRDNVLNAWALFVLSHQSFLAILDNSWKIDKSRNAATTFNNKKRMFDERYIQRLEHTQIFCRDARRVIRNCDTIETFHFIDPPYINTNCGHYEGYTTESYIELLQDLSTVEGKFMLTSFDCDILQEKVQKNGWVQVRYEMSKSASRKGSVKSRKVEVVTMNYDPLITE